MGDLMKSQQEKLNLNASKKKQLYQSFFLFAVILCALPICCSAENELSYENRIYDGTATVTITYDASDIYGNTITWKTETYTKNVKVLTAPPLTYQSLSETNPFNLIITTPLNNPGDGEFKIQSAQVFNVRGPLILQYWTFETQGEAISGILTDTHIAEGAALNGIWAWWPYSSINPDEGGLVSYYSMHDGSTIQGTINDKEAYFTIEGITWDSTRKFKAEIEATRVN